MSNPTNEQKDAIYTGINNTIVSAGAGSGKTFVLKERVLNHVKKNTTVDKLIILTFTKNAAAEMKDRIRKIISSNEETKNQVDLVDSAYITTFDSFAQSIVKKYNYLLNIDKNFTIIDTNIVNTELISILDNIFINKYKNMDSNFKDLVDNYCYKNDKELKESIINIYRNLLNILNRNEFLDNYIDNYFNDDKINNFINEYNNIISSKLERLINNLTMLQEHALTEKTIETLNNKIGLLSSAKNRNDILKGLEIRTPVNNSKNPTYDEESVEYKTNACAIEKELKELLTYSTDELIKQYKSTKTACISLIEILKELDNKILQFKDNHNAYEFSDIAFKAIDLVKNYEDVRNEIKEKTYEIMIDEYQDTNDIQEEFIKYISKDNVYMVGDVKQSIYRFRNANPYIFKNKYDKYKDGINGYKIDLTSNFRSREEVVNNINDLFSLIMFDSIGGANYQKEHKMNFGNTSYNDKKMDNYNYDLKVLNYTMPESKLYDQSEIEAFIIARDILNKINNKTKIVDKDTFEFRDITYSDFSILIDKSKHFELIKKILEYFKIPTTIYKDISVKEDDEIFIIKNLITLLTHIKNDNLDIEFKHAFMSIGRSYIYKMNDEELFDIYNNNSYKETTLYNKLLNIVNKIDSLSNKDILYCLIEEFDIINKLTTVGEVDNRSKKFEYFINQAENLNKFGLDIYSLEKYFEDILNSDNELTMAGKNASVNAVTIMTIHGSKGLEYPFVYMPLLNSSFKGIKSKRYSISSKYGFLLPFNDGTVDKTFINTLYENDDLKENISEKIRLFYVGLTRAREQIILVNSFNDKLNPKNHLNENDLISSKNFTDILSLLKNRLTKYVENIKIDDLDLSKDYNLIKDTNYSQMIDKSNEKINVTPLDIKYKVVDNKHFSKPLSKVMDQSFKDLLDYGTFMHYAFEVLNFKTKNIDELDLKEEEKLCLTNFFNHPETSNISDAKVYKEHEIKYMNDGSILHGFIDLLVEYEDHFDIIDYKLSNVNSDEYTKQLNGYRRYIESKYQKPANMYLYSIKKDIFKKISKIDE